MRLAFTNRFKRAYAELSIEAEALADKALRLLVENLRHPSLRVKKLKATEGIRETRLNPSIRLTFEVHDNLLVLRTVGRHDEALGRP